MATISIYGAGHLAQSFIEGLELSNTESRIFLFNRTLENAIRIKDKFPRINVVDNANDLVYNNCFIFIIIPPKEVLNLSETFVRKVRMTNAIMVSCANYLTLEKLNACYPETKIIRILPNILWKVGCGTTLYKLNERVKNQEKQTLLDILGNLGNTIEVKNENEFDRFGKITTCGPGIFSKLTDILINDFNINNEFEKEIVIKTMISTLTYAIKQNKEFKEIIGEVANQGGLTECAVNEINAQLKGKFIEVSRKMEERIQSRKQQL